MFLLRLLVFFVFTLVLATLKHLKSFCVVRDSCKQGGEKRQIKKKKEKPSSVRQEGVGAGRRTGTTTVLFISHSISSHSLVLPWDPRCTAVSGLQLLFPLTQTERYESPGPPSSPSPF